MIVNRWAEKVMLAFFDRATRFLPSFANSPSAARCPKSICFTHKMSSLSLSLLSFPSMLLSHSISLFFLLLFLFPSRGEAAPRASRCFICLSALFITCNLALTRARVISYWFSLPRCSSRPPSRRFFASSGFPFFFFPFYGRWTSSVTSVLGVDCYANEKCRKATKWQ